MNQQIASSIKYFKALASQQAHKGASSANLAIRAWDLSVEYGASGLVRGHLFLRFRRAMEARS